MSYPVATSQTQRFAVPANNQADVTIIDVAEGDMVRAVSRLHLEAFNGYLNARLGEGYASALIGWFVRQKEAIAIAAVDKDHRVIGYAVGVPSHLARLLRHDMLWVTVRSIVFRPWLLFDRRLWEVGQARLRSIVVPRDSRPSSTLPEPTMSLFGIGVASSHRNTGIGARLLRTFEEKARVFKMRSMLLWVYEDKIATRRLYEKCGWRPCPDDRGAAHVSKYVRLLDHKA